MEIKTNMLSLEEELTNVEINSFQEEKEYAEKNYSALDDQLFDAKKVFHILILGCISRL